MTKSQRFVAWICNSALLQDELLGDRIHKQLLTRAAPLFITMSRNSIFTIQDLTFLFQRGQGKYFKSEGERCIAYMESTVVIVIVIFISQFSF